MNNQLNFEGVDITYFFIGQVTAFANRLQTGGDSFFREISWKQCFLIICLKMFEAPPTIRELSETVGSSHQNVKQMLLKLEKAGYIQFISDEGDRRKQRILLTRKAEEFDEFYAKPSDRFMEQLYTGVDREKIKITIETLMQLEENLKKIKVKEGEFL